MNRHLLPDQILENTTESILSKHSTRSNIIYLTIILIVIISFIILPFIKVWVSINCNGIIRPKIEKIEIKSLVSGRVMMLYKKENQSVSEGEKILDLDSEIYDERLNVVSYQQIDIENMIWDLNKLISITSVDTFNDSVLKTLLYKSDWNHLKNKIIENEYRQRKTNSELKRLQYLYKKKLIPLEQIENKEFELNQLKEQNVLLINAQQTEWLSELRSKQLQLKELDEKKKQIQKEKELRSIISPVSGSIIQFSGISEGSYVQAGQSVLIISPDEDLFAEMFVPPKDIGLIEKGIKVNIQVDTFDYNQWGICHGKVKEISDDFFLYNNSPFFRVRCSLDQNFLQLKDGYKGYLKKGMTVRARFQITKRTLFQLLYDKMDDWLNPSQNSN